MIKYSLMYFVYCVQSEKYQLFVTFHSLTQLMERVSNKSFRNKSSFRSINILNIEFKSSVFSLFDFKIDQFIELQ